ncbi:MAG: carbon-nitrogen hydrolase family protein [Bacteroidetes bacterium]|nr:carbon-nitrogen hydrolase family protein [Bacteroidota bacterium]
MNSRMLKKVKAGIYQASAVHLDKEASMIKLLSKIDEAAKEGLNVLVLGETWLSGYPAWIDTCKGVALWDDPAMKKVYGKIYESSVEVPGTETAKLAEKAKKYKMVICLGVNEKVVAGPGNGTIYNSLLIFDEKGALAVHRRKLMPTFSEKLIYGIGDGKDLKAADTDFGRVGGLICWEHWMPLARQAMHNSGEHIHVALWPTLHETHQMASRHYAFESRSFVLAAGQLMKVSDIPPELDIPDELKNDPDKNILWGGSCIIGPDGKYIVEPVFDEEKLIVAELDINRTIEERMSLDTSGHYQRPDVFSFEVNPRRQE